ncbi:MAG: FemAB family PEP-CTERM system-associated protein [Parvularculaceae bacterium]
MTAPAVRIDTLAVTAASSPCAGWDDYVRGHANGTFFHLYGWGEAACAAYGYETIYLTTRRGGALAGVLALTDAQMPLLGRSLISTAFSVGGGPLADDDDALQALLDEAARIGAERHVKTIECRSDFDVPGWRAKTGSHATFVAPLIADEEAALAAIPRKRRAELRKALAAADAGEIDFRDQVSPDEFYRLYAQSLHRLGTPVFPRRFLDALLSVFSADSEIVGVAARGELVAALVNFRFGDTVLPYYVGASDAARETRAFDYLYWMTMRRAAARGLMRFDFGRSKIDSGAYHYKELWGFKPQPVAYRVKLIGARDLPDVSTANPKFAAFSKLWPSLPLAAANALGPLLAPNFP